MKSSEPTNFLPRLSKLLGIDFHVFYTLLSRSLAVLTGAGTLLLVPYLLDANRQGYYFSFTSLLGIVVFFELGVNQVVSQIAAHEAAHLKRGPNHHFADDGIHYGRLLQTVKFIQIWSRCAAGIFVLITCPAGIWFFSNHGNLPHGDWLGPWILLTIAVACNLLQTSRLAFAEGIGLVGNVARLRIIQSIVGYFCLWFVLYFERNLYAIACIPAGAAICTFFWIKNPSNPATHFLKSEKLTSIRSLPWISEVFPLQWRIALSWISGFFIYQAFVPMAFARQGPIEAGKLGLGLSIFSAITNLSMSWVLSKSPQYATYVAQGKRNELRNLFTRALVSAQIASTLLTSIAILAVFLVHHFGLPASQRIPTIGVTVLLGVMALVNGAIYAMANFMHAHKEDPLAFPSALTAAAVIGATYFGMEHSVLLAIASYVIIMCAAYAPWTAVLFFRYFKRQT